MQVGEAIAISALLDLKDECPFPHDLDDPPDVTNNLIGIGSKLATRMNNGTSTNLYKQYKPPKGPVWGKAPQERPGHPFNGRAKCISIKFDDNTSKDYPCSCSAHHLVPAQESLKGHDILEYMCEKGTSGDNNHGYTKGKVWSDVGYDTNGSENGIYLPGSYAVGGGKGGLIVWYPYDDSDDSEHGYLEVDKLPLEDYDDWLLHGKKGVIDEENACWHYVAQTMGKTPGQFHDRHVYYSENVVKNALQNIHEKYNLFNINIGGNCDKCKKRQQKIKKKGLPAPYSIVLRLKTLSERLRKYLTAKPGSWRLNIYTSEWGLKYMEAVREGGASKKAAEMFEND
jgi:hypothetical protein